MNMVMKKALNQYKKIDIQCGIESASPHRLIQMLMAGVLDKISAAKGFMVRGDISQKGEQIGWAISIIDGLRVSLDQNAGGDLVENLDVLYEYMAQRLLSANVNNDTEILDEVSNLMLEIKVGWDGIAKEAAEIETAQQKKAAEGD